jgi:CubicO group peptidase (beta-lactamase class C family)
MALAVVRDGELLTVRRYGVRESGKAAPVDEQTIFPIAYCTKSFTAAVIGKLVDAGKICWDDSIGKHLPDLVLPTQDRGIEPLRTPNRSCWPRAR